MGKHGGGSLASGGSSFGGHHHHHHHSGSIIVGPTYSGWGYRRSPRFCVTGIFCILFFVFIIVISALTPKNSKISSDLTSYESVLIAPNTDWCEGISIDTADGSYISAYKFSKTPKYVPNSVSKIENQTLSVAPFSYEYWAYHLNKQSTVNVVWSTATTTSLYFYLIIGDNNMNRYQQGDTSVAVKTFYSTSGTFQYTTTQEDDYYFVWANPLTTGQAVAGKANFQLSIGTYDTSSFIDRCTGYPCIMPLQKGSDECVLIQAMSSGIPNDVFTVTYVREARTGHYWTIFGSIIGGIVGVICIIACLVAACRHRRRCNSRRYVVVDQHVCVPPPSNFVPPPPATVIVSPVSYGVDPHLNQAVTYGSTEPYYYNNTNVNHSSVLPPQMVTNNNPPPTNPYADY